MFKFSHCEVVAMHDLLRWTDCTMIKKDDLQVCRTCMHEVFSEKRKPKIAYTTQEHCNAGSIHCQG